MKQLLDKSTFRIWLAVFGTGTILLGGAYTIVQQASRRSADDLPLSTAQTVKHQLESGADPSDLIPGYKTDLRTETIPFIIVTDDTQKILSSSVTLDGKTPLPPPGTFAFTKQHSTDHFTWQPDSGVRLATQMMTYSGGYIITGQSLKQTESRINLYGQLALITWLGTLAWTLFLVMMPERGK